MPSSHRRQGRQIFLGKKTNSPHGVTPKKIKKVIRFFGGKKTNPQGSPGSSTGMELKKKQKCAVRRCILCCSLLIILSLL